MIKEGKFSQYLAFYNYITVFFSVHIIISSLLTPHIIQSPILSAIVIASRVGTEEEAMSEMPHNSATRTISVAILVDIASIHEEKSIACINPYPMHVTHAK